jgi:DNA-binding FrmR family transcriptional regulator
VLGVLTLNSMPSKKPQSPINSTKIKIALKKAIGSINKALTLLETQEFSECSDILVQVDSAIGSLGSGRSQILDHFLDICIDENLKNGDKTKLKSQLSKLYKLTK